MSERSDKSYRVFARKYRPSTFASLIGQESLVRIMKNAFAENRIAQAFILTGVRGVGKTTTARIIAKGLNCVGPDGGGETTTEPCGECAPCREIDAGRHVDVLEMDAASRTGVNDIRDIIDGVQYRPLSARYKVYIIDEVHMISVNAFNALLKTLEEPPDHVKFIFATTEIKAVPVTVLSRCQRFDLRRVNQEELTDHLRMVASREKVEISDAALALIIRASEGSVRDALSLFDQSIALDGGTIEAEAVREMLGIADRGRILDLLEIIMKGKAAEALEELAQQFRGGVEPDALLGGLAEAVHGVSILKVSQDAAEDPAVSPNEKSKGLELAAALPLSSLARAWRMVLRAIDELASAPNPRIAAEMAVIRLCHVSDLPSPESLVRKLSGSNENTETSVPESPMPSSNRKPVAARPDQTGLAMPNRDPVGTMAPGSENDRAISETGSAQTKAELSEPAFEDWFAASGQIPTDSRAPEAELADEGHLTRTEDVPREALAGAKRESGKGQIDPSVLEHELVKSVLETFPDSEVRIVQSG